ncbi:O-succinylbenzoic acid--CoA ligase [Agromyces ramosus]|uniref:O-succinylbenzoic acid--CoA ligase n=1 Tax=Agromyces ramosus TaxID=33879 RepID=A0A4Q7MLV1_9MICO|nr:AMP-binding protein [Agromyces ramosus]RZS68653.1 O-succinylbenzoic acid--CoA ligase [Agromyces ramosus]
MKPLMQVSAADVAGVTQALRAALEGGPAVWPVAHAERHPPAEEPAWVVEDRVALVVETSGSTDAPKRVLLSADALRASAAATEAALSGPGQWLLTLPAHYIAGAQVLVRSIVAGTEPVVLEGEHFDPAAFAEASARLDRRFPRYTSLVPVQLSRLVEAARTDRTVAAALHAFDRILLGGQAASPSLILAADTLGVRITRTYGSSETAGGCVYDGRALDGVGLRIVDGSVELTGPMLADGYLGDPDRTAGAFTTDADGTRWYRTGDLGEVTHDGTLRIRGRADDVIISGGVKVSLGDVERAVRAVPGFGDAIVVRVRDPEWGERAAVVAVRTDAAAASDALSTLAAATDAAGLTPAARPVRLELVDRPPLLASGKPDRRALEALLRAAGPA